MPEKEDERRIAKDFRVSPGATAPGCRSGKEIASNPSPSAETFTNRLKEETAMSYIYEFFDNHMEISGAIVFGIVALAACIAVAAALNGAL